MKKLFDEKPVIFAVMWIVIYVVAFGSAGELTDNVTTNYIAQIVVGVVNSFILISFLKKNGLMDYAGFRGVEGDTRKMLYFLPAFIAMTSNLWLGFGWKEEGLLNNVLGILAIGILGPFLEEVTMRSLLIRAIERDSVKQAIIISSCTFGIGHIVNLLRGKDILDTLVQIVYAVIIGFCFAMMFYITKSIIPAIIAHIIINATSYMGKVDAAGGVKLIPVTIMCVILVVYTLYLIKVGRKEGII